MLISALQRIAYVVMLITTIVAWSREGVVSSDVLAPPSMSQSAERCAYDDPSQDEDEAPASPCGEDHSSRGGESDDEENGGVELAYPVESARGLRPGSFRFAFTAPRTAGIYADLEPASPPPRA